jgi:hypothetical protein
MPIQPAVSHEILNAALAGLEAQKKAIHEHITSVRSVDGNARPERGKRTEEERPTAEASSRQHIGSGTAINRSIVSSAQKAENECGGSKKNS